MSNPAQCRSRFRGFYVAIALALAAAGGYYYYVARTEGVDTVPKIDPTLSLRESAKQLKALESLANSYKDIDGDLLADPPTDPSKYLNPAELTFTVVATDDPATSQVAWKPFLDHLAAVTGKKVNYLSVVPDRKTFDGKPVELRSTEQQIETVRDGQLHVTAFNTGAVPLAVNAAGFHPLFAPADESGKFDYTMQIVVPASSDIKTPKDLKGKTLGLVALSSNSGGRAPLVLLKKEFDLVPGRDYEFVFTGRHESALLSLVGGKGLANFQAACVAGDILDQMLADQTLDTSRLRVIYKSSSFPKLCFGVPHNLDPALRAKLTQAFTTFRFTGALAKKFDAEKRVKFVPMIYKTAFADVLAINHELTELYSTAPK